MFVNEDYSNYKYIVSASDNYVILTNRRTVNGSYLAPETISIIYQYLNPSFITIEGTRTVNSSVTYEPIDISNSFFARADCLDIIKVQFILILFIAFLFNGLTRFVRKGGVLFGK